MNCLEAQAIISEALDRSPVDAALLAEAKQHCRECPSCGSFVRALNMVKRAPLPEPPEDLADRIVAAVRAEAEAQTAAAPEATAAEAGLEAAGSDAADMPAETIEPDDGMTATERALEAAAAAIAARGQAEAEREQTTATSKVKRLFLDRSPAGRRQLIAWAGAAAAILLVFTVSASLGVMHLMTGGSGPQATPESKLAATVAQAPQESAPSQPATAEFGAAGAQSAPTAGGPPSDAAAAQAAALYIVYGGQAYRDDGVSDRTLPEVKLAGSIRASLSATEPVAPHNVYTGPTAGTVYIETANKVLERFVLVTRDYNGTTYVLRSGDITEFGGWPTLPTDIPTPTGTDGSPTFAPVSSESSSTTVYVRIGSDARTGIAIPPGSDASDPAAGNPNWTWWTPKP